MNILAVHPWIFDFAAYDFWLKPYGFLVLLEYLKTKDCKIDYIDCLDKKVLHHLYGKGKYYSEIIKKPESLKTIPRYFKRYGITEDEFLNKLGGKTPDIILITSSMTYWYTGIQRVTEILKIKFPGVPVILGGTYATLCYEHAKDCSGCDLVYKNGSLDQFFKYLNILYDFEAFFSTLPDYDSYYLNNDYIVLRTSWGCIFNCSFCAIQKTFSGGFFRIKNEKILNFIMKYYRSGIRDFVFYDDALLYAHDDIKSLLSELDNLKLDLRFHTPNALHLKYMDEELACLIKKTGFIDPHFGLETVNTDLQKKWGNKVNREELEKGVEYLKKAGYKNGEFSMYLLFGYPGQNMDELKDDVKFLNSLGASVSLSEFSTVPETEMFRNFGKEMQDPLLHNNSIFGFYEPQQMKYLWDVKNEIKTMQKEMLKV